MHVAIREQLAEVGSSVHSVDSRDHRGLLAGQQAQPTVSLNLPVFRRPHFKAVGTEGSAQAVVVRVALHVHQGETVFTLSVVRIFFSTVNL